MLIVLGGHLGSGRRLLAKRLAEHLNFNYIDMDGKKFRTYARDDRGFVNERVNQPTTDATRTRLYERLVQDLPLTAKMYEGVVIDDVFHRSKPRAYFLSEVRRCFDMVVFVWIRSDEASVAPRLQVMQQKGLIADVRQALLLRQRSRRSFQSFRETPLTFTMHEPIGDAVRELSEMIRTHVSVSERA